MARPATAPRPKPRGGISRWGGCLVSLLALLAVDNEPPSFGGSRPLFATKSLDVKQPDGLFSPAHPLCATAGGLQYILANDLAIAVCVSQPIDSIARVHASYLPGQCQTVYCNESACQQPPGLFWGQARRCLESLAQHRIAPTGSGISARVGD